MAHYSTTTCPTRTDSNYCFDCCSTKSCSDSNCFSDSNCLIGSNCLTNSNYSTSSNSFADCNYFAVVAAVVGHNCHSEPDCLPHNYSKSLALRCCNIVYHLLAFVLAAVVFSLIA